jgi:hypothetical protein
MEQPLVLGWVPWGAARGQQHAESTSHRSGAGSGEKTASGADVDFEPVDGGQGRIDAVEAQIARLRAGGHDVGGAA